MILLISNILVGIILLLMLMVGKLEDFFMDHLLSKTLNKNLISTLKKHMIFYKNFILALLHLNQFLSNKVFN